MGGVVTKLCLFIQNQRPKLGTGAHANNPNAEVLKQKGHYKLKASQKYTTRPSQKQRKQT